MVLRFDSVPTVTTLLEPYVCMLVETQSFEYSGFGKPLFVGPHSAQLEGRPEASKQSPFLSTPALLLGISYSQ